jgi:glyoxylase-like metal-dependent hydrolase (beta-lactamase superfamily II)
MKQTIDNISHVGDSGCAVYLVDTQSDAGMVLIGAGMDLHGPFSDDFLSNLADYRRSMDRLLTLEADILCEGHYGIFQPKEQVRQFIEEHRERHLR